MKKVAGLLVTIIIFLSALVSVYLIVGKNKSKSPDSGTYIFSH